MSSLLGVAVGELIIPTLVFDFGVGIKTAGTASLLISLPTVAVGVISTASWARSRIAPISPERLPRWGRASRPSCHPGERDIVSQTENQHCVLCFHRFYRGGQHQQLLVPT